MERLRNNFFGLLLTPPKTSFGPIQNIPLDPLLSRVHSVVTCMADISRDVRSRRQSRHTCPKPDQKWHYKTPFDLNKTEIDNLRIIAIGNQKWLQKSAIFTPNWSSSVDGSKWRNITSHWRHFRSTYYALSVFLQVPTKFGQHWCTTRWVHQWPSMSAGYQPFTWVSRVKISVCFTYRIYSFETL